MSLLSNAIAIPQKGGYDLTDSVRFRSSASAYLSRTPSSAGNRKTFTFNAWIKKSANGVEDAIMVCRTGSSTEFGRITFNTSDKLDFWIRNSSSTTNLRLVTTKVFRDPSAWYHIIFAIDTTQSTASDRAKLYVNGTQETAFDTATYPTLNQDLDFNTAVLTTLGVEVPNSTYFDGYMTEVNFVDGQALTASDFGEYDNTTGVWKPKEYTGTYGTNGFYLPMKATTQASGFNTVTYTGTGTSGTKITDVGFQPDLVWIKNRDNANNHGLWDSVRGYNRSLESNTTNAESYPTTNLSSFDADGFTLGSGANQTNNSSYDYVAWCWDAGSSTVSNTDGSITSSVRANPDYGFSIVTYNATTTGTVGHGLGSAPKVIILKYRDIVGAWITYHSELGNATKILLNATDASSATSYFNSTDPTNDVFSSTLGGGNTVAYCFSEVAGFSKFGSYTGTGSSGNAVTTGFRPAFVMVKSYSNSGTNWAIHDNTRDVSNPATRELYANLTDAEYNDAYNNITFTDTGFTLEGGTVNNTNASGQTYIYMAFADTRDYQWNFDASGNKNNWTPNNINSNASSETTYDIMSDVPTLTDEDTANFATLNPLSKGSVITLSEANLRSYNGGAGWTSAFGTIGVSTGKWYWEATLTTAGSINAGLGITSNPSAMANSYIGSTSTSWGYHGYNGTKWNNNSSSAYGATWANGDVIGVALDLDAGTLTFYKNNSSQGTAFSSLPSNTYFPAVSNEYVPYLSFNFGQRPFAYTPPIGYKKLNTYNLPDSAVKDGSKHMNPVLYTGNGTSQSITGVGFSPDLVWIKFRSSVGNNELFDTVRGAGQLIVSNLTTAESTATNKQSSFDSDGFSVGSALSTNTSGGTYVSWNWRGSDSTAVSNTDGGVTSTVSANTTSGFSVVTADNLSGTSPIYIGHGLGIAPSVVIGKIRDNTSNWYVQHTSLPTPSNSYLMLNSTAAYAVSSNIWDAVPSTTTFRVGNPQNGWNGGSATAQDYVFYCFAEIEGFSKFGSYTGNGSANGPFVYTGFRPAVVIMKNASASGDWHIRDAERPEYNVTDGNLVLNANNAETSSTVNLIDITANGFKIRGTGTATNGSGNTIIYMAFAENPFKNSLAR